MNNDEFRSFIRQSDIKLSIPLERCVESLELIVAKIAVEENIYLRSFYTIRAHRLLTSMVDVVPEIGSYYKEHGNLMIMALLTEPLEKYETVLD